MKNVVFINGGRGAAELIPFFIDKKYKVTSIINAYDDGKSTGVLRNYFNTLGPSDFRKVLTLMLDKNTNFYHQNLKLIECRLPIKSNNVLLLELKKLVNKEENIIFNTSILSKNIRDFIIIKIKKFLFYYKKIKKIKKKDLNFADLSILNCIIVTVTLENNNKFDKAIDILTSLFNIKAKIYINSNQIRRLVALRCSGKFLNSEAEIVESRSNIKIFKIYLVKDKINKKIISDKTFKDKKIFLSKKNNLPTLSPNAIKSISKANFIIFCPGTQHSSLYPTYMSKGFKDALLKNKKCKKIFITNIGADYETPKYDAFDYLKGAYNYLNDFKDLENINNFFDLIIINKPKNKANINYVKFSDERFKYFKLDFKYENFENIDKLGTHDVEKIYKYIK